MEKYNSCWFLKESNYTMKDVKNLCKSIAMMLFCSVIMLLSQNLAEARNVKIVKKGAPKVEGTAAAGWKLRVAQQKLKLLGFSQEKPSGKLTEATGKALKEFQKQHRLPVSGKLDTPTYNKLNWLAFAREGITNVSGKAIVDSAAKYNGVPYVFGGTTPKGFDCSGYVQFIFKKHNAQLPRVADEQVLKGLFVTQKQLRPGDLVFFTTYAPGASHVGIYAGSGRFWHTSSSKGVMLSSLQDVYWKPRYYGARRVLVSNGEI